MELKISGGDLLVLHENLFGQGAGRSDWHGDAGVVMLGVAAALFVVAGWSGSPGGDSSPTRTVPSSAAP